MIHAELEGSGIIGPRGEGFSKPETESELDTPQGQTDEELCCSAECKKMCFDSRLALVHSHAVDNKGQFPASTQVGSRLGAMPLNK